ncbi:MAG: protein kinase, partial [Phycisphaeraceae bacterium]
NPRVVTNPPSLLGRIRDRSDAPAWTLLRLAIERLVRAYIARRAEAAGPDWRPPRVEQLLQDVLVHLWLKLPALDLDQGIPGLRQGLYRVVVRCLAQQEAERKFRRTDPIEPSPPAETLSPPVVPPAPLPDDSLDTLWQDEFKRMLLLVVLSELRDEVPALGDPAAWTAFEKHWLAQRPAEDIAAELAIDAPQVFTHTVHLLRALTQRYQSDTGELFASAATEAPAACPSLESLLASIAGLADADTKTHIESCDACKTRLELLAAQRALMKAAWPDAKSQASPAARVPTFISKYFIAGILRGNDKYIVYRAADADLDRDVALQLSSSPITDENVRRVMTEEGAKLLPIVHPSVSRVLELEFVDNRPMIVTEFVRGPAINDVEQLGSHKPARTAAWGSQLAEALAAVHAAGVWHLDIQPRHVRIDETGRPRLLMLGSAMLQQVRHGSIPEGDPAFLSPEQARGDREALTAAADVFSIGALLFHLLTGDVAYPGNNREEIRQAALQGRVDLTPLEKVNLTARLGKLVTKALSPDPSRRPDDLKAWAEQLRKSTKPGFIARMLGQ